MHSDRIRIKFPISSKPAEEEAMTVRIKVLPTPIELILKVGTALLITFAATVVLVHAEAYLLIR